MLACGIGNRHHGCLFLLLFGGRMDTKKMLGEALLELLGERSFRQITAADILTRSGLSRSTFYKHFTDKYDLAKWVLVDTGPSVQAVRDLLQSEGLTAALDLSFLRMEEWCDLYRNALNDHNKELTRSHFFENARTFFLKAYEIEPLDNGGPQDMARDLIIEAAINFLLDWGIGKTDLPRDKAVEVFERLWIIALAKPE